MSYSWQTLDDLSSYGLSLSEKIPKQLHSSSVQRKKQYIQRSSSFTEPANYQIVSISNINADITFKIRQSIFNTSEVYPPSLFTLACSIIENEVDFTDSFRRDFLGIVGAFLTQALTTYELFNWASELGNRKVVIKDSKHDNHILSSREFYSILANEDVPGFDIHDLAHHSMQLRYTSFYSRLMKLGLETMDKKSSLSHDSKKSRILEELVGFLQFATMEYGVVGKKDLLHSSGCLNWQSPRKSPLQKYVNIDNPSSSLGNFGICGVCVNSWNAVRALCSLKRRQTEVMKKLKMNVSWFEDLGYELHPTLQSQLTNKNYRLDLIEYRRLNPRELITSAPSSLSEMIRRAKDIINYETAK